MVRARQGGRCRPSRGEEPRREGWRERQSERDEWAAGMRRKSRRAHIWDGEREREIGSTIAVQIGWEVRAERALNPSG